MDERELILQRTNRGYDVFRYYIDFKWKIGRKFFNPLYNDTKASCCIALNKTKTRYVMMDYGSYEDSGDCFFLVGRLNGLDSNNNVQFVQIMKIIDNDLSLGCFETSALTRNFKPKESVQRIKEDAEQEDVSIIKEFKIDWRIFTKAELDYWNSYGVNENTLKRFKVISLKSFESVNNEGNKYTIQSNEREPMFGYATSKKFIKIYRPFSSIRFLYGGVIGDYCFGLNQLPAKGDVLYITGGEKDVLSLSGRGFNAICFNSETSIIPESIVKKLSYMFKHIVLLYDMDKTGLKSSLNHSGLLSKYGVKRMLLPLTGAKDCKDISDFFKIGYTAENLKQIFITLLDSLYSDTISILNSCEIDLNSPPKTAQTIISINGVSLGSEGNLLCITGSEGSGKSNFVASLVAGALNSTSNIIDTLGVTVAKCSNSKAVLLYDTEQSESQLYKNSINVMRRAVVDSAPVNFKVYSLVGMARKTRMQSITESMDRFHHKFGGIHLVVIDGIADLVRGANDEAESVSTIEELYRLAGIYNTCIICVLHLSPTSGKLRGHLGSELQRKSAAIISIDKDKDPLISTVKALKVRDGSPLDVPVVMFKWNKEREMHTYYGEKTKRANPIKKQNVLQNIADKIFEGINSLTYDSLLEQIQRYMEVNYSIASEHIDFMVKNQIIFQNKNNYYLCEKNY